MTKLKIQMNGRKGQMADLMVQARGRMEFHILTFLHLDLIWHLNVGIYDLSEWR
jgi:hypothetical protein